MALTYLDDQIKDQNVNQEDTEFDELDLSLFAYYGMLIAGHVIESSLWLPYSDS